MPVPPRETSGAFAPLVSSAWACETQAGAGMQWWAGALQMEVRGSGTPDFDSFFSIPTPHPPNQGQGSCLGPGLQLLTHLFSGPCAS